MNRIAIVLPSSKLILAMAVCVVVTPPTSQGAVSNGGFESGTLTGWTLAGSGYATGAAIGVSPTEGSYQGYIETTGNFTDLAPAVAASLGLSGPTILGLGAGTPTNGTGISQDVIVTAGDTLTFDWNFLTDELDESATYNDFAFFSIGSSAFLLASRNSSTYDTILPPPGFDGQTDWTTQSYTFAASGTFKIGFGVFNVGDTGHNSALLVDAVSIEVPEPATGLLTGLGSVILTVVTIHRRMASPVRRLRSR